MEYYFIYVLKKVEEKPDDFWPVKVHQWKACPNGNAVFHSQMKHREES